MTIAQTIGYLHVRLCCVQIARSLITSTNRLENPHNLRRQNPGYVEHHVSRNTSNCCSSFPRLPSSYQVVFWKQERFLVVRTVKKFMVESRVEWDCQFSVLSFPFALVLRSFFSQKMSHFRSNRELLAASL